MLSQIDTHPVMVFLIMTSLSIFLFAATRLLMDTLYVRVLCRRPWLAAAIEKLTRNGAPPTKKLGVLGLALFVALPMPGTGVVGGTILSWLAGLKWHTSFLAIIPASALENVLLTVGITGLLRLAGL